MKRRSFITLFVLPFLPKTKPCQFSFAESVLWETTKFEKPIQFNNGDSLRTTYTYYRNGKVLINTKRERIDVIH